MAQNTGDIVERPQYQYYDGEMINDGDIEHLGKIALGPLCLCYISHAVSMGPSDHKKI